MAKKIFLTGASSGIGRHLAGELAAAGHDLAICARREPLLAELCTTLQQRYPQRRIVSFVLDVTHYGQVAEVMKQAQLELGGLDTVIVNAGIDKAGKIGSGNFNNDRQVVETNVLGAMATIDAAAALFRPINRGHIVVMASVAAFCGLPGMASYAASKAAIASYAQSARFELHKNGIKVTTLYPGFIDTAINQNIASRPFLVTVEQGSRKIAQLIEREVDESAVPAFPWKVVGWLLRNLPNWLLARVLKAQH
ncbi:SDR family oxidoreductase [Gynuella sunshinyii]|uniref:SDR family oxidoreductase n=1 Tax=Gynuella sunshinyii TaxID=1445505 RepID=UPI0014706715|nr:SDR family oxidoreductase [Gynuella sunshinyii]